METELHQDIQFIFYPPYFTNIPFRNLPRRTSFREASAAFRGLNPVRFLMNNYHRKLPHKNAKKERNSNGDIPIFHGELVKCLLRQTEQRETQAGLVSRFSPLLEEHCPEWTADIMRSHWWQAVMTSRLRNNWTRAVATKLLGIKNYTPPRRISSNSPDPIGVPMPKASKASLFFKSWRAQNILMGKKTWTWLRQKRLNQPFSRHLTNIACCLSIGHCISVVTIWLQIQRRCLNEMGGLVPPFPFRESDLISRQRSFDPSRSTRTGCHGSFGCRPKAYHPKKYCILLGKAILKGFPILNHHLGWHRLRSS